MSPQKTILVVEDEELPQVVFKVYLEDLGLRVVQAFTLEEGGNAFDKHGAILDGIIMDHNLGDGYSTNLVKKIRGIGFVNPIIAFSGSADSQKELLEAGCSHRIDRKGDVPNLAGSIKEIIKI